MIRAYIKGDKMIILNGKNIGNKVAEPKVHEELNGIYSLTFKILCSDYGKTPSHDDVLSADTPDGEQKFRVHNYKKDMNFYYITAYHIFYDLASNFIEDINIVEGDGSLAIRKVLDGCVDRGTASQFQTYSNIDKKANCRIVRYSPVQAILGDDENTLLNRWGGELHRDNHNIRFLKKLGERKSIKIEHKVNLLGYECELDFTSVVTVIMPRGYDGISLPEKYVESRLYPYYPQQKIKVIDYSDIKIKNPEDGADSEGLTEEEAYNQLRQKARDEFEKNKIDEPKANYKVNFVDLSKTREFKKMKNLQKLKIGDEIEVIHKEHNLSITARVISYEYDPIKNRYYLIELGNYVEGFTSIFKDLKKLEETVEVDIANAIDEAKDNATKLIRNGFGGYVRVHPDRILIMDKEKESEAKNVWQWNKNGFGFSKNGVNGIYETAMTIDGSIVADFIKSGTIDANLIKTGAIVGKNMNISLTGGTFRLGSSDTNYTMKYDPTNGLMFNNSTTQSLLPTWVRDMRTTQINGREVITPRIAVGSKDWGVMIGDNVFKDSSGNWVGGLVGHRDGKILYRFYEGGGLTLGSDSGRQFTVYADGSVSMPRIRAEDIEAGTITANEIRANTISSRELGSDSVGYNELASNTVSDTHIRDLTLDVLRPGKYGRIVIDGRPGDNDAASIDANYGSIRLKCDAYNYVRVDSGSITFYTNRGTTGTDGNRFWASEFQKTSDVRAKENIKVLGGERAIKPNTEVKNPDITLDDIMDFIKNVEMYTYNYQFSNIAQIGTIAQKIEKFDKVKDYIVQTDTDNKRKYISIDNMMSMNIIATQQLFSRIETLEKEIEELKKGGK